ncbi:hypothetical protein SLA2020_357090 [Shorea laevis]
MCKDLGLVDRIPRLTCAQTTNVDITCITSLDGRSLKPAKANAAFASIIQLRDPVSTDGVVYALKNSNDIVEEVTKGGVDGCHGASRFYWYVDMPSYWRGMH